MPRGTEAEACERHALHSQVSCVPHSTYRIRSLAPSPSPVRFRVGVPTGHPDYRGDGIRATVFVRLQPPGREQGRKVVLIAEAVPVSSVVGVIPRLAVLFKAAIDLHVVQNDAHVLALEHKPDRVQGKGELGQGGLAQ